jgi:hypothetical protein
MILFGAACALAGVFLGVLVASWFRRPPDEIAELLRRERMPRSIP